MINKILITLCLSAGISFSSAEKHGNNNDKKIPSQNKPTVLKSTDPLPAPEIRMNIDNNEYEKPSSQFEVHIEEKPAKAPAEHPAPAPLSVDFCSSTRQNLIKSAVSQHLNMPCQDITKEDLKRVRSLVIENTNITSLKPEDLEGLEQIVFISFENNRLKTIHPRTFENLTQLTHLNLSYNLLENISISEKAFNSLMRLNTLNLSKNLLKSLPASWFSNLSRLNHLDLSYNLLEEIPQKSFDSLKDLITLNLAHNKIKNFPPGVLNNNSELIDLDLSFNQIQNIDAKNFNSLVQLVRLNLSHNNLTSMNGGAFRFLQNLRFLDFSNNNLTDIDWPALEALPQLETLNYSRNPLNLVIIDPARDSYTSGWNKQWYECWAIDCWNTYAFLEVNNQKYKWMECQGEGGSDSHCAAVASVWLKNLNEGYSLILKLKQNTEHIKSVFRRKKETP